jgi:hypothetical protein
MALSPADLAFEKRIRVAKNVVKLEALIDETLVRDFNGTSARLFVDQEEWKYDGVSHKILMLYPRWIIIALHSQSTEEQLCLEFFPR